MPAVSLWTLMKFPFLPAPRPAGHHRNPAPDERESEERRASSRSVVEKLYQNIIASLCELLALLEAGRHRRWTPLQPNGYHQGWRILNLQSRAGIRTAFRFRCLSRNRCLVTEMVTFYRRLPVGNCGPGTRSRTKQGQTCRGSGAEHVEENNNFL